MIKVTAYSRVNFGLIALNDTMKQIDGSFGTALDIPAVTVEVNSREEYKVFPEDYRDICNGIIRELAIDKDVNITIKPFIKKHCGLGFGTQLRLAIAKALILHKQLKVDDDDLLGVVKRGGTSNLGYYSFLYGGFIVEGGHRFGVEKNGVGAGISFNCPHKTPLLFRGEFPEWGICLITPKEYIEVSGKFETQLFEKFCPVPVNEVNELSRYILMGIMPAVQTADFDLFCYYIEKSMKVGFRSREIDFRMPEIAKNIALLKSAGFRGIGMTSFGPTVFGFARSVEEARERAKNICGDENKIVTVTTARNKGAGFETEEI